MVYDVGDSVMIDDQALFVKEFGLFSTTFEGSMDKRSLLPTYSLRPSNSPITSVALVPCTGFTEVTPTWNSCTHSLEALFFVQYYSIQFNKAFVSIGLLFVTS
ncbi:hypothetical protein RSAG8_11931, partial [Rhizoctonia solani AG-8 WAC10335]